MTHQLTTVARPTGYSRLTDALVGLKLHDHVCLVYETRQEQLEAAVAFVRIGLQRNEQCLYIVDENSVEATLIAMVQGGIDVDAALNAGALKILSSRETYLKNGRFGPDEMISLLRESLRQAKESGFSALRVTGEVTWALSGADGSEKLIEYEVKLNQFLPAHDIVALCQYNRNRFPAEIIRDVIRTHPLIISSSTVCRNFHYVPPEELLNPAAVTSEVDRLLTQIRERELAERLLANHETLEKLFSTTHFCFALLDTKGNYVRVNRAYAQAWRREPDYFDGKNLLRLVGDEESKAIVQRVVQSGTPESFHHKPVPFPKGTTTYWDGTLYPLWDERGLLEGLLLCLGDVTEQVRINKELADHRDHLDELVQTRSKELAEALAVVKIEVEERKRAETKAREHEELLLSMINAITESAFLMDCSGTILACNEFLATRLGAERSHIIGKCVYDYLPVDLAATRRRHVEQAVSSAQTIQFEDEHHGRLFQNSLYPVKGDGEQVRAVAVVSQDVTERRRMEKESQALARVLAIINTAGSLRDLISELTSFLTTCSGCSAVGIRLRDGDDFPYYETRGFPPDFIEAENRLCVREREGVIRDSAGNPLLECMCGNVLMGRFDPSKPFFTENGSFWTNSTTRLLAQTDETDRLARTRNRCNGEGYESVALIPIRAGGETLGLLQFNDKRQGKFTPEMIAILERIATHLAIGLASRKATEALRASEQRLRESERRQRAILDNIPDPVWLKDLDGRYLAVNEAWSRAWGWDAHEVVGRTNQDFMSVEATDLFQEEDNRLTSTGQRSRREQILPDREGRPRSFDSIKSPIYDGEDRISGIVGIARDITEHKQALEALRASEERYRTFFLNAAVGIAVDGLDGRVLQANENICRALGYSQGEIAGMHFSEFTHPDDVKKDSDLYEALIENRIQSYELEKRYIRKDGGLIWGHIAVSVIRDHQGFPKYGSVVFIDITERKLAEEAFRHIKELQAAIISASPLAIITVNVDGCIQSWNAAAERIFGWAESEVVGRPIPFVPDHQTETFTAIHNQLLAGNALSSVELLRQRKNGSPVIVSLSTAPIRDKKGELIASVAVLEDISERKRTEDERKHLEDQLRQMQKLEALGQMAAGLAHDFKNLLTILRMAAEIARNSVADDHPAREPLDVVQETVDQATSITNSLLSFGQVMPTEKKPFKLSGLVGEALGLLRHVIPSRIQIVNEISPGCECEIMADRNQIHQVLINLAMNARDAMPHEGVLTLRIGSGTLPSDSRCLLPPGSRYVRVTVTDTGSGIRPELLPRIFDPFFTTKARGQGTGLGLSLVHGIIADHGGYIEVESQVGRGTEFTITLPLMRPPQTDSSDEACKTKPLGTGELLLVAIADGYELGTLAGFFQKTGYRVLMADNEKHMLSLLESHRNDIRVLILGGGLAEDAILEFLRETGTSPRIPALVLPGYTNLLSQRIGEHATVLESSLTLGELAKLVRQMTSCGERKSQ